MTNLAVVAFKGRHTADEVLLRIMKMEQNWEIDLYEVAVITRDQEGKVNIRSSDGMTTDGLFAGATIGSLWGLLIGAITLNPAAGFLAGGLAGGAGGLLAGALDQADTEDEFVAKVGSELGNNSSALAVIGWTSRPTKLLNELEGLKGKVIETTLSVSDEKALREALAK